MLEHENLKFGTHTHHTLLFVIFFLYLVKERKIQVKSIEGYQSPLNFILKRSFGYDLSSCQVVADLFCGFKLERPPRRRTEVV